MPPFSVLSVCMGNICRSPMAERLLVVAARDLVADKADELILSGSAGTGGWHQGQPMNPPAARQVRRRGGDDTGFAARKLRTEHIESADLVLTATADQAYHVRSLCPDAAGRTFVLGEFGRLLAKVDLSALPPAVLTPDAVYARGRALVEAVDAVRAGAEPLVSDEIDDPYGHNDAFFSRVADEIEAVMRSLAAALFTR
jgi:protein-tyrosine phosphatase